MRWSSGEGLLVSVWFVVSGPWLRDPSTTPPLRFGFAQDDRVPGRASVAAGRAGLS
ncbi:MAG: hypothetical protein LAT75_10140 [Candidatus Cyclonatronum sp.]|uniref:hypothetical protein n=1 Tax=Cyclonatronum sp. TaxID=3024185 RepID=UPI0025B85854|nr:hypothetical protein [Cyclonatronum sp.]MCH8487219.1 hypothetical protein [Cyclonatronum sp.]